MKPYLLKVPLIRKEPEIHFDTCQVDHVITLSEPAFLEFQHNLMTDRDFLREFNREYASSYTEGVRPGLLVLGEGSDDGIFVCTEGYDYARYSAYVPNARQILLLKEYPSLQDYGKEVAYQVDRSIQKALTVGLPDEFRFSLEDVQHQSFPYDFNVDLFLEMLGNRPEVENIDIDGSEVILTISQEYLPKREQSLRTISDEDFKIACAKHLLWSYGAGGEQADFSNCAFDHVSFSGMELNSAIFDGAVFRNCYLSEASFCFASFRGCTFLGCSCQGMTAEEAAFQKTVFDQCDLNHTYMTHSDLTDVVFQDCHMEFASIQNSLIRGMRLEDVGSGSLRMDGTTDDVEAWNGYPDQSLSTEELQ